MELSCREFLQFRMRRVRQKVSNRWETLRVGESVVFRGGGTLHPGDMASLEEGQVE
jgi:hypothetical protein